MKMSEFQATLRLCLWLLLLGGAIFALLVVSGDDPASEVFAYFGSHVFIEEDICTLLLLMQQAYLEITMHNIQGVQCCQATCHLDQHSPDITLIKLPSGLPFVTDLRI